MISKRDMYRLFITTCIVGAGKANYPNQDEWGKLPENSLREKYWHYWLRFCLIISFAHKTYIKSYVNMTYSPNMYIHFYVNWSVVEKLFGNYFPRDQVLIQFNWPTGWLILKSCETIFDLVFRFLVPSRPRRTIYRRQPELCVFDCSQKR